MDIKPRYKIVNKGWLKHISEKSFGYSWMLI
ncbi:hypothetical protein J2Y02_001958 [Neobacillus drentensis]|nr:hypothetical protein [Neobacillus drentensis]